mmetsp:Transcript_29650/g.41216  ORF Transcript_29650/g.41216 Transcript_29650/m.41216 type:complete len:326 (+) Transcript_29650:105-1082(+)
MPRLKFNVAPKCFVCSKSVYQMEKLVWDGVTYHKQCFRCLQCNSVLQPKSVAMMSGDLYCKGCFKKLFSARGRYDDITKVIPGTQKTPKNQKTTEVPARRKSVTQIMLKKEKNKSLTSDTVPNFTRQRSQTEKQLSNKSGESVVARLQRRFSLNDLRDKSIPFSERKGKFAVQPKSKKETPLTLPDSNARTLKFKKKNSKPSFSENQHDQHQKTIEFKGTKPKRSSITTMKQTSSDKSKETLRQRLREESMKNSSQKNIAWEENNSKNFEQESSKEEVFRSRAIAIDDGRSNLCCFLDKSTISNRIGKSLVRIDRVSLYHLQILV